MMVGPEIKYKKMKILINICYGAFYHIGEYDGQEWIEVTLDEFKTGLSEKQLDVVSKP